MMSNTLGNAIDRRLSLLWPTVTTTSGLQQRTSLMRDTLSVVKGVHQQEHAIFRSGEDQQARAEGCDRHEESERRGALLHQHVLHHGRGAADQQPLPLLG